MNGKNISSSSKHGKYLLPSGLGRNNWKFLAKIYPGSFLLGKPESIWVDALAWQLINMTTGRQVQFTSWKNSTPKRSCWWANVKVWKYGSIPVCVYLEMSVQQQHCSQVERKFQNILPFQKEINFVDCWGTENEMSIEIVKCKIGRVLPKNDERLLSFKHDNFRSACSTKQTTELSWDHANCDQKNFEW